MDMFIYIHIYLHGFTYYTCVYLRELIHELYHSDASLQPSHVVATIIIGQRPAIATIYSGTHIYIYVCVCVYCVLCPPYTTTLYRHRRTPLCRASNCKRSGRYNCGRGRRDERERGWRQWCTISSVLSAVIYFFPLHHHHFVDLNLFVSRVK